MPYYQAGDYYQGDYYQGDFLGLGKFAKKVVNIGSGIVSKLGIPIVSGAAGLVNRVTANQTQLMRLSIPGMSGGGSNGGGGGYVPEPGVTGIAHRAFPGGSSGLGYYNRRGEFVEGRRPRMNPTNVRALRRAGRRVKGFLRIASRLGALPVNRGKGKLFKRKRR